MRGRDPFLLLIPCDIASRMRAGSLTDEVLVWREEETCRVFVEVAEPRSVDRNFLTILPSECGSVLKNVTPLAPGPHRH